MDKPSFDYSGYITISAWAHDFARAMVSRPKWIRLLLRVLMGRYAYREFIGMQDALNRDGQYPFWPYELQGIEYHKDCVPFDFAVEREPIPLKKSDCG